MKIAYFDCFSGISGDMTLGAFLDAGLNFNVLRRGLSGLDLKGYGIRKERVRRGGIAGTKFECIPGSEKPRGHRSLKEILAIIDKSALGKDVRQTAKDIFLAIGRAEAKVHGISFKGDVRLAELGDIDSIIDIVGTAIAIDALDIDEIHASRINLGRGVVRTKHGMLPVPAPAAIELLRGAPVDMSGAESELVTPTGAGILKTLSKSFGMAPQMTVSAIGYGAGSRSSDEIPNMLRVMIGEAVPSFCGDRVIVIEANIDDMSPQNFEYIFERLFGEGALDVYTANIQMKKSRPAFKLTVLTEPHKLGRISAVIFKETTTIGMRYYEASRLKLDRKLIKARTRYGEINVKVSSGPGGIKTVSPEYEECARIARKKKAPFRTVYEEAKNAIKTI